MARYSPMVLPQRPEMPDLGQAIADAYAMAHAYKRQQQLDRERAEDRAEAAKDREAARRLAALQEALYRARLYEAGLRPHEDHGTNSQAPEAPSAQAAPGLSGLKIGLAADAQADAERNPLTARPKFDVRVPSFTPLFATDTGMDRVIRGGGPSAEGTAGSYADMLASIGGSDDRPIALPGQFVRGVGYTSQALYAQPSFQAVAQSMLGPERRPTHAPGRVHLTDEWDLDLEALPEARQQAREAEKYAEAVERYIAAGLKPEQAAIAAMHPDLLDDFLFPKREKWVPSTKEEAIDYEVEVARRTYPYRFAPDKYKGGSEDPDRVSATQLMIGLRQLALDAARTISRIPRPDPYASPEDIQSYKDAVNETLSYFGYGSLAELQDDLRRLRIGPEARKGVEQSAAIAGTKPQGASGKPSRRIPNDPFNLTVTPPGGDRSAEYREARDLVNRQGWDAETARSNLKLAGFEDWEIDLILGLNY